MKSWKYDNLGKASTFPWNTVLKIGLGLAIVVLGFHVALLSVPLGTAVIVFGLFLMVSIFIPGMR